MSVSVTVGSAYCQVSRGIVIKLFKFGAKRTKNCGVNYFNLRPSSFFFFTSFSLMVAGIAAAIRPAHLSTHQHGLHFAWMKSQTVLTKILFITKLSCCGCLTGLFPLTLAYQVCLGSRSKGILLT